MSNILGQLLVKLGVDTASFFTGMDAASKQAKKTSKEIEGAFDNVGDALGKALGNFGEVGSKISELGHSIGDSLGSVGESGGGISAAIGLIAGLGVAAIGAAAGLTALALEGAEVVERLGHISEKTGISTHDLLVFEAAGKVAGVSLEEMVSAMRKFDQAITGNGKNAGAASVTLRALGITARDNKEALLQAADAFKNMEDGPTKAADAVALFGKAGLNMIPFLNKGRDGVLEFTEAVNVFGPKVTAEGIEATDNWKVSIEKLDLAWKDLAVRISEDVLPALSKAVTGMAGLVRGASVIGGATSAGIGALLGGRNPESAIGAYLGQRTAETAGPSDAETQAIKNRQAAIDGFREHYKAIYDLEKAGGEAQLKLDQTREAIAAAKQEEDFKTAAHLEATIPMLQAAADAEKLRLLNAQRLQATYAAIEASFAKGGSRPLAKSKSIRPGTSPLFALPDENAAPDLGMPDFLKNAPAMSDLLKPGLDKGKAALAAFYADWDKNSHGTVQSINDDYAKQWAYFDGLFALGEITEQQFKDVSLKIERERLDGLKELRKQNGTSGFAESFGDAFQKIADSGRDLWRSLAEDGANAVQSLNGQLASIIVTGKGNLAAVGKSLEENIVQSSLKHIESSAIDSLGLGKLGAGKPDGTESNPIYVAFVNSEISAGGTPGLGGLLSSLSGNNSDSSGDDSSGGGGILSGIASALFGGFRADGGDVSAGKAYVVGENHPELFVPGKSGAIVPGVSGGDTHNHYANTTFNIQTPDADSFRRSKAQIMAEVQRQTKMAYVRNGSSER
jgi:hypothetical protein